MSIPAYPKLIPIYTGSDTIFIQLFGDEHNKIAETTDGYSIIQKSNQWFYALKDTDGSIIQSQYKISSTQDENLKHFLESTPKHLRASYKSSTTNKLRYNIISNASKQQVVGERRILVILMEYTNLKMKKKQEDFDKLFNGINYKEDGAQGSVCDYYKDVSYNQLQLVCDVLGPFTSTHPYSYYGANDYNGNDKAPEELFEEAIKKVSQYVTLKDYDADDDGYVDNVHIIFAGHGEEAGASDEAIWSHEATFFQPYEIQGMKIDSYSCAPELRGATGNGISRIGPHCHEIGHALGAMDYYDTNYETEGNYIGTGNWDIMASGSWNNDGISPADFNPYVKAYDFGWITPKILPQADVTIYPSNYDAENYYLLPASEYGDYYMLENRNKDKWGSGLPGKGLLIYHISPLIESSGNKINSTAPQHCYIVCASSKYGIPNTNPNTYGDINSSGCPYPGTAKRTEFGHSSIPTAFYWNEEECRIDLKNIEQMNDGSIHLYNNTDKDSHQSYERIFFEDFENNNISIEIPQHNYNEPAWLVIKNDEYPTKIITRPNSYKGDYSLQLSATRSLVSVSSTFNINIESLESDSKFKISLYANSILNNSDVANIIKVSYKTGINNTWEYTEFYSSENNHWQQFSFLTPEDIISPIIIEGVANSGTVLAIDNIEIFKVTENEQTNISRLPINDIDETSVYSINGIQLQEAQKGINIIRTKDGQTYKVFIK